MVDTEEVLFSKTTDGGYIIAGSDNPNSLKLIKTDLNGNPNCNQFSPPITETTPITLTNNAVIQFSGDTTKIGNPNLKISSGGIVTTLCYTGVNDLQNKKSEIIISQNPFSNSATAEVYGYIGEIRFDMFDIYGRKVKQFIVYNSSSFVINRDNLTSGIYFYSVGSAIDKPSNSIQLLNTGKIVVE